MNEPIIDNERRRFFRITDSIDIRYHAIDDTDGDANDVEKDRLAVDAQLVINSYDQEIAETLAELKEVHPLVAKSIDALNKKINMLSKITTLDFSMAQQYSHSIDVASISACGIAFPVNESFVNDTSLQIALLLKPSGHELTIVGRVVDCEALEGADSSHYLRVEFVDMSHLDRERLIQHIVQRQGALLKSLRDQFDELH